MYILINKKNQILLTCDGDFVVDDPNQNTKIKVDDALGHNIVGKLFINGKVENPPAPQPTLSDQIHDLAYEVAEYIDQEARKKIYYYGLGFIDGMASVAKHATHPDAIKLMAWSDRVWSKASGIHQQILDGKIDPKTQKNQILNMIKGVKI